MSLRNIFSHKENSETENVDRNRWLLRQTQRATDLSERLSIRAKKYLLFLFCVCVTCLCVHILFQDRSKKPVSISRPQMIIVPELIPHGPGPVEDRRKRAAMMRILRFRKYIDSLEHSPEGRVTYDSLRRARPGLFDSLNMIEQLYQLK